MGLGGYLAGKTEQDHYKVSKKRETMKGKFTAQEIEETKVFANIGLSAELGKSNRRDIKG